MKYWIWRSVVNAIGVHRKFYGYFVLLLRRNDKYTRHLTNIWLTSTLKLPRPCYRTWIPVVRGVVVPRSEACQAPQLNWIIRPSALLFASWLIRQKYLTSTSLSYPRPTTPHASPLFANATNQKARWCKVFKCDSEEEAFVKLNLSRQQIPPELIVSFGSLLLQHRSWRRLVEGQLRVVGHYPQTGVTALLPFNITVPVIQSKMLQVWKRFWYPRQCPAIIFAGNV